MDAFVSYEQDFKELRDSIRKRVEIIGTSRGDAKRKEISLAQEELQDIEEVFQSLRLTAQSLGAAPVKAKVKVFEGELAELKAAIRRAETFFGSDADRGKLMGGVASASDLATTSGDQRGAVARDTERLRHTTDVIKDALRVASETEQIGRDSMQQLHTQHDEIESSRNKLRAVDQSLATANRLMRGMARRIMTNKLITMVIALILLGGIGLIVWLKWFDSGDSTTDTMSMSMMTNTTSTMMTSSTAI
jgi:vesicle transport through interaction with t-SNAREs protein 1